MQLNDSDPTHCFRCKGLAVIDKTSLMMLPKTLWKTTYLLTNIAKDADVTASVQIEAEDLAEILGQYAVMIEDMPDD